MTYPLVSELAAEGIAVAVACGVLGFSRQAYYAWRANPVCDRDWRDAHLVNAIYDIHADDPQFGYRLIADELEDAGWQVCENTVQRLCSEHGIWSTTTRRGRKAAGKRAGPPVHDDLVQRDFDAPAIDRLWLVDITEHPTSQGTLYACVIKDACSNRIVGYACGPRMTARLATAALRTAIARRRPAPGLVVHSDRGSQFRSRAFCRLLRCHGLTGSMGRRGAAADNAAMESFFALLQKNVLNQRPVWTTRQQLRVAIVSWIESTYNHRRRQRALGKLSPAAYELMLDDPAADEAA